MKQPKGPNNSFEKNLSVEVDSLIEAVAGMGDAPETKGIDLTDVTQDENRIRFILIKDEAATVLSNLFTSQYGHRADLCAKFGKYSSQVLVRREYRLVLTEIYKAALAVDEDSTAIYLVQLLDEIKREFVEQTREELPRSVDDVSSGVRTKLRMNSNIRAQLSAGGEWAGNHLEGSTKNIAPMYRTEGGGGTSRHQNGEWNA